MKGTFTMKVYRYIPFEHFKELVEKKELRFVNPLTEWDDSREGYLFRQTKDENGLQQIKKCLLNKYCGNAIIRQIINGNVVDEIHVESHRRTNDWFGIRCMSWCEKEDFNFMWQNYGDNEKAVMITAELFYLKRLKYKTYHVEGFEVNYKEVLSVYDEIDDSVNDYGRFDFPLIYKTKSEKFKCEKEYRLYIVPLDEENQKIEALGNIIYVPIEPSKLITEVLVNPYADENFVKEVQQFCEDNDIKFAGQSIVKSHLS